MHSLWCWSEIINFNVKEFLNKYRKRVVNFCVMINPLDELSDIYLGQISEADNSPEAINGMQHVRAIRYRQEGRRST